MSKKKVNSPKRGQSTTLDPQVISKLVSAGTVLNSLPAGSKHNFDMYCKDLIRSKGLGEDRGFDKCMYEALKPYLLNPSDFKAEKEYLRELVDPDGFKFSRNLKIYSKASDSLLRFSEPDHPSFRWNENYRKALKEVRDEIFRLHPRKLHPLTLTSREDVIGALSKLETHSGFTFLETGMKKKGDNIDYAIQKLEETEEQALKDGTRNRPILLGFRTQGSGEYNDDGSRTNTCKHKLRVILMVDLLDIIAEMKFINPIQDVLMEAEWYASGKSVTYLHNQISTLRHKYPKFVSIDYSSFDQTIPGWLLEDAIDICRDMLVLSDRDSQLFEIVKHDLVHKRFLCAEGVLFVHKGMPSGKRATNLLDTLCNYIAIKTYLIAKQYHAFCQICGDDNNISCREDLSLIDLASYIQKNFGLKIKTDDKSNEGIYSQSDPKFLSRVWREDGPWKHPHQLISKLLYSERRRKYVDDWNQFPNCKKVWNEELKAWVPGENPYYVIYSFILEYYQGMKELIDVGRFNVERPVSSKVIEFMDTRNLPGSVAYHVGERKRRQRRSRG